MLMASLFLFLHLVMQAKILRLIFKHSFRAMVRDSQTALKKQELMWREMITSAVNTEFGREHRFEDIENLRDFKRLIPIQNYESLEPMIAKMMNGQKDILWPGKIKLFAKSSGTSNAKSKFIPLSKISLADNHYKGGRNILSIYCHEFPNRNIFEAKNLSVAGSFSENQHDIKIGDLSSLLLANLPKWVQLNRLPSKRAALMLDWELKIEEISEEILKEDIASLSGVPSWNLILLQKVLKKSQCETLFELWPHFQLYMHGGVNFEPYKKSYTDIIGNPDLVFLETYNASEGFFAIQDTFREGQNGMLLLCNHAVFYEFLPIKLLGIEGVKTLQLDEVVIGENYALIITTKSGLWRYMIGDTLRFISLEPFRIVLTGRVKYFINVFGEELIEENANDAIKLTCAQLDCTIEEFTVGPIFPDASGRGGHEWLIEFKKAPKDLNEFAKVLDVELKKTNSDYEAKRSSDLALQLPVLKLVEKGTFFAWLKSKNKLGAQHKVPRLQNHRMLIEDLLKI